METAASAEVFVLFAYRDYPSRSHFPGISIPWVFLVQFWVVSPERGDFFMLQIKNLTITHRKDLRVLFEDFSFVLNRGDNVLLPDEPTRNFPPLSGPVIRQMPAEFPGTIISISHDRKFIGEVCDRIYRLSADGLEEIWEDKNE